MKLRKRLAALALAALTLLTCLTGCGSAGDDGDRLSLSVRVGDKPATYDPIYAEEIGDQTILNHLYENLMRLEKDENGQITAVSGAAKERGCQGKRRWHRDLYLPSAGREMVRWR